MTFFGWCPGSLNTAQMLTQYPGTTAVRLFRSPGQGLPAWTANPIAMVPAGVHILLSWKDWPYDLDSWLNDMPTSRQGTVTLTYRHEPEQGVDQGDLPAADFIDDWEEIVDYLDDHPKRSWIKLAPIYTAYWATHGGHDWHDFWPSSAAAGIDAIGWDVYNDSTTVYNSPAAKLEIMNEVAAETGKPWFIGEWGSPRITSDPTGAGCAAWMTAMADQMTADGCTHACFFHADVGGTFDLIANGRTNEVNALRAIVADSAAPVTPSPPSTPGTSGTGSGLSVWSASTNSQLTTLDFGTVNPGSSDDLTFRVKNLSSANTAQGVTVSLDGTHAVRFYLSTDGRRFAATATIGNLPPSAVSGLITLRRVIPSAASNGEQDCDLRLRVTAWA